jgi:oligopeptide/dipeptide ABC transporter ATP-binding protein
MIETPSATVPLLRVQDLRVDLVTQERTIHAVRGLTYELRRGEALGMVGESGSGKSVSALAVMGLLQTGVGRVVGGSIEFEGQDLSGLSQQEWRRLRGRRLAMIFQDPLSSLNPIMTVGKQISEVLYRHLHLRGKEARNRAIELLRLVGIPGAANRFGDYPHQFSGGMRQRVMIAMSVACDPLLLIADEPTTALDVTVQAQILDLFARLQSELGMAFVLISHDLGVVARFADRVAIVYAGKIVESGGTRDVLARPLHPYTRGLLASMPRLDQSRTAELKPIVGAPPDLGSELTGCPFLPRCPLAFAPCVDDPPMVGHADRQSAACWAVT